MNTYEKELLQRAYNHFLKTGNLQYQMLPENVNNFIHIINAAQSLSDEGYIVVLSDTLERTTFTVVSNTSFLNDLILQYELTDLGLDFAESNF